MNQSTIPQGQRDTCACGCAYYNGPIPLTVAQILLFAAALLSLAAVGDCRFVKAFISGVDDEFLGAQLPNGERRGLGFYTFEGNDGGCYLYKDEDDFPSDVDNEDALRSYIDFLGSDWEAARILGSVAAGSSWFLWYYIMSYICSAQIRAVRYATGAIYCLVLVIFQGITFIVLNSGFCDRYSCDFGRSAGLSVGALLCFFFGGICFFASKDYPGKKETSAVEQPAAQPVVAYAVEQEYLPQEVDEEETNQTNIESGVQEGSAVEQPAVAYAVEQEYLPHEVDEEETNQTNIESGVQEGSESDGNEKDSQTCGNDPPLENVVID